MTERIAAAAILDKEGAVWTLPKPSRHCHIIHHMVECGLPSSYQCEQGFVTSTGRFISRVDAAKLALANSQVDKLISPPRLYSEDLW